MVRNLSFALLLLFAVGCGSHWLADSGGTVTPLSKAAQTLRLVATDPVAPESAKLVMQNTIKDNELRVTLSVAGTGNYNRVLCEVHFDQEQLHVIDVDIANIICPGREPIQMAASKVPTLVAVGQVSPRLVQRSVAKGTLFATIKFASGPVRHISEGSALDPGLRLHDDQEFVNEDVPLRVSRDNLPSNEVEVDWEEALVGDLNHDGVVSINDLTPLGADFDRYLHAAVDYTRDDTNPPLGFYLADNAVRLRNDSQGDLAYQASPPGPYAPLRRCEIGKNTNNQSVYPDENQAPWYTAEIKTVTPMGDNYGASTADGYRLYFCSCQPGTNPSQGLFLPNYAPRSLADVKRANTLDEQLNYLNMAEFSPPGQPYYTYRSFCHEQCGGQYLRNGRNPLPDQFRMYRKVLDVGTIPAGGDSFIMVEPLPGSNGDSANSQWGAYTYTRIGSYTDTAPPAITWQGNPGITALQLGQDDWPAGAPYQLRLQWGTAQFDWQGKPVDPSWQIRYAVYYSWDSSAGVWPNPNNLPTPWYPASNLSPNNYLVDLPHPADWLELVNAPSTGGQHTWVGVRAYAYKEVDLPDGTVSKYRRLLNDTNTVTLDKAMPSPPQAQDTSQPTGLSLLLSPKPEVTPFNRSYILTAGADASGYQHAVPNLRCSQGAPFWAANHHDSFAALNPIVIDNLADLDANGKERNQYSNFGDIELRCEVYRTLLDESSVQQQITTSSGFAPWRDAAYSSGTLKLHGVAYEFPRDINSYLNPNYTRDPELSQYQWYEAGTGRTVLNTLVSGAMPGTVAETDSNGILDSIYASQSPARTIDWNWYQSNGLEFATRRYWPGSLPPGIDPAWTAFGANNVTTCNTEFADTGSLFEFVDDPQYEYDLIAGHRYNYFIVLAANDPAKNCSYGPTGWGDAMTLNWFGPIEPASNQGIDWSVQPNDFLSNWLLNEEGKSYPHTGSTASMLPQARFPSLAVNPVTNGIGVSYYDVGQQRIALEEATPTLDSRQVQTVDLGTYGDTSLVYDSLGKAHVAYLRLLHADGSVSGGGHAASFAPSGGIYYRDNTSGPWGTREAVDQMGFQNASEFQLFKNALGQYYCILPTVGTTGASRLGVPGRNLRSGTSWGTTTPLPTDPSAPTSIDMDSVKVDVRGLTFTYVVMYDGAGKLLLGTLDSLGGWTVQTLLPSGVNGYPSIINLPSGDFGISFMAAPDNRLQYGIWNGSTFTTAFVSKCPNDGYQSVLSYDSQGAPVIFSINSRSGILVKTQLEGSYWQQTGMFPAGVTSELLQSNTISVGRSNGNTYVTWVMPSGHLGLAKMTL